MPIFGSTTAADIIYVFRIGYRNLLDRMTERLDNISVVITPKYRSY